MPSIKTSIYITLFLVFTLDFIFSQKLGENIVPLIEDEEITTIISDDEEEFMVAIELLNELGGKIYIDTPVITLEKNSNIELTGELSGGIIGIRQANGEYPRIIFNEKKDLFSGINIFGSNQYIEYLIIENVQDNGITLMGDNNILDHVISRYNYGHGFAIYGNYNTLNFCYSYRNAEPGAHLIVADGFYIDGEVNNVFNYCFAWDNSNSGFNYDKILLNPSELIYLHSASWNNGNINVFTGKYDYDNGNPLDKNLKSIKLIMESDPSFVSNYYNKKYNIDKASIDGVDVQEWSAKASALMEGNGFTFGNRNSSQIIDVKRNALYCVAFDNKAAGFVDNYNYKYNAHITNCASFNNNINYFLLYTFSKWEDNWSWGSINNDLLNKVTTKKPSNANTIQNLIYSVRNQIIKAVSANMFPDGIIFDICLKSLKN